jgi:hypothetical protein
VYRQKIKKIEKIRKWIKNMQKNVREIAVIMQDKEKEYKICEKLRRQPELRDLKILCREQLQSLGPSETFNKRLKRLQPLAGRVLLTDLQDTELPEVVKNIPSISLAQKLGFTVYAEDIDGMNLYVCSIN